MFNPEKPPELQVAQWINAKSPVTLAGLKGRVVVLTAFQMLCPGCVTHGLPQAKKIVERFSSDEVAVVGLHTVFEHHDVMTAAALQAFVQEYRWPFAIGIDKPDGKGLPKTMAAYEMRGTPTLLLFDRQGRLRRHYLGQVDDIRLSAEIMGLAIEAADASREVSVAIERKFASTLLDPDKAHGHSHGGHEGHDHAHGDDCGCGHDHAHDHGTHGNDHAHVRETGAGGEAGPAPAKPGKSRK